jgi:hypothetical protein
MNLSPNLPPGYECRTMIDAKFEPIWEKHAPSFFDVNSQVFRVFEFLID